jgi:hypothetical protein
MSNDGATQVANLINGAVEFLPEQNSAIGITDTLKPRLLIEHTDPHRTVAALRDILASHGPLFERASPVRLVHDRQSGMLIARPITADNLVMMVHDLARPYQIHTKGDATFEKNARFPKALAQMYQDWHGAWNLQPLNGIAATPLLSPDGSIFSANGYDKTTGYWLDNVLDIAPLVALRPTREQAQAALAQLRSTFATFCFADAVTVASPNSAPIVDLNQSPGQDETAFLVALLTAVCRPSLDLAPGILVRAPQLSGAGSGKGLLVRSICQIAFGREPHAVTSGDDQKELEKRISAELIGGGPVLFLDNINNVTFKSNLLASAITERPARVRILGKSEMFPLNATALVVLTGNALTVSEDLARRFITIELDPHIEDPETRAFPTNIRKTVIEQRSALLAAALTIWRWGRVQSELPRGLPLGSFDQWARWVRDPLLALGCFDPVQRLIKDKKKDGHRQEVVAIFQLWHRIHGEKPVTAFMLSQQIKDVLDPQKRGRQFIAAKVAKLTSARVAGFTLTRQESSQWEPDTYSLLFQCETENHAEHRDHRADKTGEHNGKDQS